MYLGYQLLPRGHVSMMLAVAVAIVGIHPQVHGQQLERDAVAVAVTYRLKYEWSEDEDPETSFGFTVGLPPWDEISPSANNPGWNTTDPVTREIVPGKDYVVYTRDVLGELGDVFLQVDVPKGYRVYLDDLPRSRALLGAPGTLKLRVEVEEKTAFSQSSNLRPGRIVWTAGLGGLSNGKSAGELSLRALDLSYQTFQPGALTYDNASPEVEKILASGALRQIYAAEGLVDIVTDNGYQFRVRFFHRSSGQIGSKVNGLYTTTGDPLSEYVIENPAYPTYGTKIRVTRTLKQGGETLVTWTEFTKDGTNYTVVDWVEKPSGGTTVTGPVVKSGGTSGTTNIGDGTTTVLKEIRSYTSYSWGSELTEASTGTSGDPLEKRQFSFTDALLREVSSTGISPTYYQYHTDFDRTAQQYRIYEPWGDTAASWTNDPTVAKVTTLDYEVDWTGRKGLLKTSETRINNTLAGKVDIAYSYETLTDSSRTYSPSGNATMQLVVATRKDYYDSTHFLTSETKKFREDADPSYRFFGGLPFSEKRADGTMTMYFYYRGTFNTTSRTFTVSTSGDEILQLTVAGTSNSSGATSFSTFALDGQSATSLPQSYPSGHLFYVVAGASSAKANVKAVDGRLIASISYVCTSGSGGTAWQIIQRDVNTYVDGLFLQQTTRDSGNTSNTWDVVYNSWTKGRLNYSIDESGMRQEFSYDSAGRMLTSVKVGGTYGGVTVPTRTTTYTYDAAGHVLSETISATGTSEVLVTTRAYDVAGRLTSETTPGYSTAGSSTSSAVTTSYTYSASSASNRSKTITLPTGSTSIETFFKDGSIKSKTGTAVVAEYQARSVETDGSIKSVVSVASSNDPRKRETWTDWIGRTVKSSRPGFTGQVASEEASVYDDYLGGSTGRLIKSTKTGYSPTLFGYNTMSQLVRSGMDIDSGGALVLSSSDRISDQSESFEYFDSAWWRTKIDSKYPFTGGSASTAKEMGKVRQRLTGLTATLRSESRSYDPDGNETRVTVTVDASNRLVTTTSKRPGMATDQVETVLASFSIEVSGHDGLALKRRYDALGRLEKEIEPRTGSESVPTRKTTYHPNTTWVKEVKDAANKRLSFAHYDGAGRGIYTEDALSKTTRTSYTARNEVSQVWGTATYPVSYVYNSYGERTALRTYRDSGDASVSDTTSFPSVGAYDETVWEFDAPSGLLKKKTDAKGKFVEYSYNQRGQTYQRFWSRLVPTTSNRVAATFSYDSATGEHTGISYNDSTPSVTYTYTRLGQVDSVSDTTGTRDFVYDGTYPHRLSAEALDTFYGSRVLTRTYESTLSTNTGDSTYTGHTIGSVPGRVKGLQVGSVSTPAQDLEFIYATSNAGRIAGLVSKRANGSASQQFVYGYETNSALVKSLSIVGNPFFLTREFESNRDLITSVEARWNTTTRTKYTYVYDDRGQRESVVQSGDVFADYGGADSGVIHKIFTYNGRSELTAAGTYLGATASDQSQPLSARKHEFAYDGIGNRKWSNTSGSSALRDNYTVNELNQYVSRENNTLAVGGTVANDANIQVAVGTMAPALAGRRGRHWGDNVTLENWVAPFQGDLKIFAVNATTDKKMVETRTAFLPPAVQVSTYDEDGNISNDGVWSYQWDAENRLWAMQTTANAIMGGVPAQRLEFKYDSQHRRVEKLVRGGWNGSAFTTVTSQKVFLYDGWSLIAEFTVSGSSMTLARSYTWGLDIARSLSDAGGVGALLQIRDHSLGKNYFPSFDGNGNIAALFDGDTGPGSSGSCVAAYEYSPYGELLRCEGSYAKENSFRFSTKFSDDETGLVYYGKRYYQPSNGRFLGRDPIGENGGINLHGYCTNDPVNGWDLLGCDGVTATEQGTFLASVTDLLGNSRQWTFSNQTDAQNWFNAWADGNASLLQPYLEEFAKADVAARAAGMVGDPVTASIYLNQIGVAGLLRDALTGYDNTSDDNIVNDAIHDYGVAHIFTVIFGSPTLNIKARTITLLVGADTSLQGGFASADRENIISNAKTLQKFLDDAHKWNIRVNLLISPRTVAAQDVYRFSSASPVHEAPQLSALLGGASRVIPMLVTSNPIVGVGQIGTPAGITTFGQRGSVFARDYLSSPILFAHELGHSGSYLNYRVPTPALQSHAPSGDFNNVMHEGGVSRRFSNPADAFVDGYWLSAMNKVSFPVP